MNTDREANKGRRLKIGYGHDQVEYIEKKIDKEGYSPDAVIGEIKAQGLRFSTTICTRTLYSYIGRGLFLNISNQDLPVKKEGKKREYRRTQTVALNNTTSCSINEKPEEINIREEFGHWEMDCVVGKGKARLLVLIYYAHPYSAFERGSNENANRLIRRFIPKRTDIGKPTYAQISHVEHWRNNYPGRIFGYRSAVQVMQSA